MKKFLFWTTLFLYFYTPVSAALLKSEKALSSATTPVIAVQDNTWPFSWLSESLSSLFDIIWTLLLIFIFFFLIIKIIRIFFELYYQKNLVYLKITLPRNDSKLDKEHETKKDFKEKIGMMSMFYKAIHKLSEIWFKDTVLNWFFDNKNKPWACLW